MAVEHSGHDDLKDLLVKIHDEAAAALANGAPETLDKALNNIVAMARYQFDPIPEKGRVR